VSPAAGEVFDFCALKPRADSTRFVKQRVIVFAPAAADSIAGDAAIKAVEGPRHLRDVFAARFPLDRFHNIVATLPGRAEWATAAEVSLDEVGARLGPQASRGDSAEASREARFLRYSLACADYVAFPSIESHEAKWDEKEVQTKGGGKKKVKVITLKLTGAVGIFRRDGAALRLVQTVRASVPGMLDFATDITAGAIPDVDVDLKAAGLRLAVKTASKALRLPPHLSAVPGEACALGRAPQDGVAGLAGCPKQGTASGELAASTLDERAGPVCREARSEGTPAPRQREAMVICEVRSRAAQLARALQKEARGVEGWKLFAPLEKALPGDPEAHTMSLGREEGVKTGHGFFALSPARERLAYFKVTSVGPGGEKGTRDPSELSMRFGAAPLGSRLEEYPQIGISLMPYFGFAYLTQNHGKTVVTRPDGAIDRYRLSPLAVGGGAYVSYDLSGHLGAVETYLRIGAAYFVAPGWLNAKLLPVDVMFEKGFYIGTGALWYLGVGGGLTVVKVNVPETGRGGVAQKLGATVYGAQLRTGLDYMLSADASLRFDVGARLHFNAASYETSDGSAVANNWDQRADHYSMLTGGGAFNWTF
jgi:hypothetical protein